jgi:hypothetical protein
VCPKAPAPRRCPPQPPGREPPRTPQGCETWRAQRRRRWWKRRASSAGGRLARRSSRSRRDWKRAWPWPVAVRKKSLSLLAKRGNVRCPHEGKRKGGWVVDRLEGVGGVCGSRAAPLRCKLLPPRARAGSASRRCAKRAFVIFGEIFESPLRANDLLPPPSLLAPNATVAAHSSGHRASGTASVTQLQITARS